MNRRKFFKSLAAIGAGVLAPSLTRAEADLVLAQDALTQVTVENAALDPYICFVHPSMWRELWKMSGRGRWEAASRRYRIARRSGAEEMDARGIIARYGEPDFPPPQGELGTVGGVRFITSASVS